MHSCTVYVGLAQAPPNKLGSFSVCLQVFFGTLMLIGGALMFL